MLNKHRVGTRGGSYVTGMFNAVQLKDPNVSSYGDGYVCGTVILKVRGPGLPSPLPEQHSVSLLHDSYVTVLPLLTSHNLPLQQNFEKMFKL